MCAQKSVHNCKLEKVGLKFASGVSEKYFEFTPFKTWENALSENRKHCVHQLSLVR